MSYDVVMLTAIALALMNPSPVEALNADITRLREQSAYGTVVIAAGTEGDVKPLMTVRSNPTRTLVALTPPDRKKAVFLETASGRTRIYVPSKRTIYLSEGDSSTAMEKPATPDGDSITLNSDGSVLFGKSAKIETDETKDGVRTVTLLGGSDGGSSIYVGEKTVTIYPRVSISYETTTFYPAIVRIQQSHSEKPTLISLTRDPRPLADSEIALPPAAEKAKQVKAKGKIKL